MTPRSCFVSLALSLAAASAVQAAPAARLEHAVPGEVRFQVGFDAPQWREGREGEETAYRYLIFPGAGEAGEPGDPALPMTLIRVAVPATGRVDVAADVSVRGRAGGLRFPPMPSPEPATAPPGRREDLRPSSVFRESAAYFRTESPPWAEIVSDGIERGLRVIGVAVRPVRWNPATGDAEWAERVSVTVSLPPAPRGRAQPLRADRVGMAAWRETLVNPEDAPRYLAEADSAACPPGVPPVWFDDAPGWLKIHVAANGVYRLGRTELVAAGLPLATLDPRTLRLFSGPLVPEVGWTTTGWDTATCDPAQIVGKRPHVYERPGYCGGIGEPGGLEEIALWVQGEDDGTFDAADVLVFYALGPDNYRDRFGLARDAVDRYIANPYTDETIYWLTWGGELPGTPRRMDTVSAAPAGGTPVAAGRARLHAEENTFRDPAVYRGGWRWEEWFWDFIRSDEGVKRYFVNLPHAVGGSVLDARIRLWGAKIPSRFDSGEARLHHVDVTINGADQGITSWGGSSAAQAISPREVVITGAPAAASSEFRFLVPAVPSTDASRLDAVHLAWIDATYVRTFDLNGAAGELELDGGAAGQDVRVANPPSGNVEVFDVTDFRAPRRLLGGVSAGGAATFHWDQSGEGVIALVSEGTYGLPRRIDLDSPPSAGPGAGNRWLRDADAGLDYVILTSDALVNEAQELADWRREHLWGVTYDVDTPRSQARIRVVRVSDIMDEFAWGMWDPLALRHFLEYAYRYYRDPSPDPGDPLAYCLFLGDATNYPRDHGSTGVKDVVPSWEDNRDEITFIASGNPQYVSDDVLVRFDGRDAVGCPDLLSDLYIGRITVNTADEARALIRNKVLDSERAPRYGRWRAKAILIADDICQGTSPDGLGFVHMTYSDQIGDLLPPPFFQDKIYLYEYGQACVYNSKPLAKQALLESWGEGAWLVNYIGHGADVVWADEHVLDLTDTPLLANDHRFPVVGSFSCSVGKFSNPTRDGLGEAHLRARNGGALVSAAATQVTFSYTNQILNYQFIEALFPRGVTRPVPVGVALMHAKRRGAVHGGKYVCLGDPASPPPVPADSLVLSGPSELKRGETVEVIAREVPPRGPGTLDLEARDATRVIGSLYSEYKLPGALLFRGKAPLDADSATVRFTVPKSLRGGPDGKIHGYAWGEDWDAVGAMFPLLVGGTGEASSDRDGPVITFPPLSETVVPGEEIAVVLEDPSGINLTRLYEFSSILLKVFDRNGLEQYRQDVTERFEYDSGSATRGTLTLVIPDIQTASYTFTLSATDNLNNASRVSLDLEVGTPSPIAEIEKVETYPNPFNPEGEPAKILFTLSRTAQVAIRIYSVSGRLVRKGDVAATAGSNVYVWDGRDTAGDAVANGVYLVQLTSQRGGSEETRRTMERLVVLR